MASVSCGTGELAGRGMQTIISKHDTKELRESYKSASARFTSFKLQRNISGYANRRSKIVELLAIFSQVLIIRP